MTETATRAKLTLKAGDHRWLSAELRGCNKSNAGAPSWRQIMATGGAIAGGARNKSNAGAQNQRWQLMTWKATRMQASYKSNAGAQNRRRDPLGQARATRATLALRAGEAGGSIVIRATSTLKSRRGERQAEPKQRRKRQMSTWTPDVEQVKLDQWRAALEIANGNITRAAVVVKISRGHATKLMRRFKLSAFAAELRVKAGAGTRVRGGERAGVVTGRPHKK
jgi:hypothetical protein